MTSAVRSHQHRALDALSQTLPGSTQWEMHVLELRVLMLDHAGRAELARATLEQHVPQLQQRRVASDYATERMRAISRTSPVALARAQLAMDHAGADVR